MKALTILLVASLLQACSTGRIFTRSGIELVAPVNSASTSSVKEGNAVETLAIPEGSTIVEEKIAATTTTPSVYRTTTTLSKPTEQKTVSSETETILAPTRAPDQAVALRKADNAARSPLLWASMAAGAAAIICLVLKWPTPAAASGVAAVIFFISWQASGLPVWFWMIGLAVLACGGCIVLGYKRGEWDNDGNNIPDFLEKKKTVTTVTSVTDTQPAIIKT